MPLTDFGPLLETVAAQGFLKRNDTLIDCSSEIEQDSSDDEQDQEDVEFQNELQINQSDFDEEIELQ